MIPAKRLTTGATSVAPSERGSQAVLRVHTSPELVFGVVGHVGSGASEIAKQLAAKLQGAGYDVHAIKARELIVAWAERDGHSKPEGHEKPTLAFVSQLQDLGDNMRQSDHAAVAQAMVNRIRAVRAKVTASTLEAGVPVVPDDKRRAYILDSIRHPAEVELLRQVYQRAFVLIGVVCEEDERLHRITKKYSDAGEETARAFMERDAKAKEKHGQRVSDAFHLSDVFLDNTASRLRADQQANPDWTVPDQLSRVVKLVTRTDIIRPTIHETAMHAAHGARMRSACLSRQVGAAVVDSRGNLIATGTNEVPKPGGGVYGSSASPFERDHRCAFTDRHDKKYCSNTREQEDIVAELMRTLQEVVPNWDAAVAEKAATALRESRIGGLLEFSRAVHAEMDAILAASRSGKNTVGGRLYVTTFPCHYCARHIVCAGIDEVQYIEPYPKSRALKLHADAITESPSMWLAPSCAADGEDDHSGAKQAKVLFRPFTGVAPRLYERAFQKDVDLKDDVTGDMRIGDAPWGDPWVARKISYAQLEAELSKEVEV